MIPLTAPLAMKTIKEYCVKVAEQVMAEKGVQLEYQIGTMIETARGFVG